MQKWFRAEKRRDESFEAHSGLFDLAHSDTSGPWSRPRRFTTGPTPLEPGVTGGGTITIDEPAPPKVATQVLERFVEPAIEVSTARIRPLWSRVSDLVTSRSPAALQGLVRCNHTSIERHFVCGTSAPHVDAWCGAAHCPRCSHHAAAEAGATARTSWPERVLVARASIGLQGGATLPTPDEVLGARSGWGKVAQGLGLDPFGLVVVVPGAVLFFVGAPAGGPGSSTSLASGELPFGVVEAGGQVGLRLSAEVGGCDAAAATLEDALTLEARRFEEVVVRGVESGDLGPASEVVAERDPKRTVVFASKRGLPCPATRRVRATPRPCPIHGGCDADGTVVLHGSIEVRRAAPLPDAPTRQAVLGLF